MAIFGGGTSSFTCLFFWIPLSFIFLRELQSSCAELIASLIFFSNCSFFPHGRRRTVSFLLWWYFFSTLCLVLEGAPKPFVMKSGVPGYSLLAVIPCAGL